MPPKATDVRKGEARSRRLFDYLLQPPEAAIDPSEDAVSIYTALAMQALMLPLLRATR